MRDHVHSPSHNQIPPTSPSDKKRQKKKKRARPGENNFISFKSYHDVFFFYLKHDYYYLELFVSGQSQLCDSKLASKHVLLVRLKLQPSVLYEFRQGAMELVVKSRLSFWYCTLHWLNCGWNLWNYILFTPNRYHLLPHETTNKYRQAFRASPRNIDSSMRQRSHARVYGRVACGTTFERNHQC